MRIDAKKDILRDSLASSEASSCRVELSYCTRKIGLIGIFAPPRIVDEETDARVFVKHSRDSTTEANLVAEIITLIYLTVTQTGGSPRNNVLYFPEIWPKITKPTANTIIPFKDGLKFRLEKW